ncbi:hypothetical protein CHUAL_005521 [Chamberlinius hualienensis]
MAWTQVGVLNQKSAYTKVCIIRRCLKLVPCKPRYNTISTIALRKTNYQVRIPLSWSASELTARCKSSQVTVPATKSPQPAPTDEQTRFDPLDLNFENAEAAYKSKTNFEILRALLVFSLCSSKYLVENNMKLMKLGRRLLGKKLFSWAMKCSFYGHFVAGEDQYDIQPKIDKLRQFGVKSILDYSVEEDISNQQAEKLELESCAPVEPKEHQNSGDVALEQYHVQKGFDRREHVVAARTYFYLNEAQCEKNMEVFLNCIDAVSGSTNSTGFAAIKMTALGRPQLLMQLSEVIALARRYFEKVTGLSGGIILQDIKPEYFEKRFNEAHISTDNPEVKRWLSQMTYDQKGLIHLFSWSGLIDSNMLISDLFKVPSLQSGKIEPIISALTEEEEEMFRNLMRRLRTIINRAIEKNVRVMVDAEQTYFQPAISRITMELMRKYNKDKNVVFNTYQCYLKNATTSVVLDLEQAERQNFYFGAKLVRGAYMDQERRRATTVGYEDPILPTYEDTNKMYENTLEECLKRIKRRGDQKIAIMVASHNEDTVRFTVNKMKEFNLGPRDRVVCFGQLLGMCDQVSFPLGQAGYSVYKYVPYGPVGEVLPYLSRRAQENTGILKKVKKEQRLLLTELKRRLMRGQFFYHPKGHYQPV